MSRFGYSVKVLILLLVLSGLPVNVGGQVKGYGDIGSGLSSDLDKNKGELTISKWDGEVYFKIRTFDVPRSSRLENGKDVLEYQNYTARIYEIETGMEFEIVLYSRPLTNVFNFNIDSKGLQYFYQPPLEDEVFEKGWFVNATHAIDENGTIKIHRPVNVVGSYAVYGFKRDNEYKTGKVGHIYRPLIYDSKGVKVYGELLIEGSTLSITVPDLWLDEAVYPVIIDPIFGKTDKGASSRHEDDYIRGGKYTGPVSGTGISMHVYYEDYASNGPLNSKMALYLVSDLSLLAETDELVVGLDTDGWLSSNFIGAPELTNVAYWLTEWKDEYCRIFHDTGGPANGYVWDFLWYNGYPDPLFAEGYTSDILSIYVTYSLPQEYYLDVENFEASGIVGGYNASFSMDLETNGTPAYYWFSHNFSGAWENMTAQAWTDNGTVSGWAWVPAQIGLIVGVRGYANTTTDENATAISSFEILETEMWTQLLFGDGAILGFILINAILIGISIIASKGGLFSGVIGILVFMFYVENLPPGTFEMWLPIAQILATLLYFFSGFTD